ncbi:epsE [Symbiodinium natans]|uniref:EpsE protein n=1 Tax=Symbiodinium natans TaxID=878477 RepID=A0A812LL49_9DINO|nr:epsE [Symbiodinium natans]
MLAWFCRCRRRDAEIELDQLDVPTPKSTSPSLEPTKARPVLPEPASEPPTLVTRRRNPRRTRVFVRMPSGDILPADLDLNWTIAQASDYIIANCSNEWLEGLGGACDGYSLRASGCKEQRIQEKNLAEANHAESCLVDEWWAPWVAVQQTGRLEAQENGAEIGCAACLAGQALAIFPAASQQHESLSFIGVGMSLWCKTPRRLGNTQGSLVSLALAILTSQIKQYVFLAVESSDGFAEDAKDILIMEPKNTHALQVVARKRKSLTRKVTDVLPLSTGQPEVAVAVFLFSEDRPLQCYACLKSLQKHVHGAALHVTVFWQASERSCIHSYQLLEALPELRNQQHGEVAWLEVPKGQLYGNFSRTVSRLSADGIRHLLILSDAVVFHTNTDLAAASALLSERSETFAVRLDLNPRIEHFPAEELYASAPRSKPFANDPRLMVWTRSFDSSKMAYEAVPRESGWDDILCWTASLVRAEHVAHFFSALQGKQVDTVQELDDKAADWLSRRQRMKRREVSICTACFMEPLLITFEPGVFGSAKQADGLFRAHLLQSLGGKAGMKKLAHHLSWSEAEVSSYFQDVDGGTPPPSILDGLLQPERYRASYFDSTRVPLSAPSAGPPRELGSEPLVSWLIPARNCEDFLLDCFRSIEQQAGVAANSYEIVVVEDASEDGTSSILQNYAEKHPNVRVVDSNGMQQGVAGCLREGWEHCRGSFVARLDADDEAARERIVKQLRFMDQHPSVSVLGGRHKSFFTEHRKFTVEKISKKEDGRVVAAVWREFHGQQTSRAREQICLAEKGEQVLVVEGPAEYLNCRLLRVGEESMLLHPERWQEALSSAQGGRGEVLLLRRDPLEPAQGCRWMHPCLVRAASIFEECLLGTTCLFRKSHFGEECPFKREEAENHWLLLGLEPTQHAANIADVLVHTRRHTGNRSNRDEAGIFESRCAAIQDHLKKVHSAAVDMHDGAALLQFRGPRTPEQGEKLLQVLEDVERSFFANVIRPEAASRTEFWQDFVAGREVSLERAIVALRQRFKALYHEVAQVITSVPDNSPREHRSRTPPR